MVNERSVGQLDVGCGFGSYLGSDRRVGFEYHLHAGHWAVDCVSHLYQASDRDYEYVVRGDDGCFADEF